MQNIFIRNNKIYADFRYLGHRFREPLFIKNNITNLSKAQKAIKHIKEEINTHCFDFKKHFPHSRNLKTTKDLELINSIQHINAPPFASFALLWFKEKKIEWKNTHQDAIQAIINNILIPHFKEIFIHKIGEAEILAFRNQITTTNIKASRINHIMAPLRMIIKTAARRFDFQNPFKAIKDLSVCPTNINIFTIDEINILANTINEHFKNYILLRCFTGLRTGEIDALTWEDIDFKTKTIHINKAYYKNEVRNPKTKNSYRHVLFSNICNEALQAQRNITKFSPLVFPNLKGLYIKQCDFLRTIWYPALKAANLRKRKPYHMRHTAASLWLSSGESPVWIARQLGHGNPALLFSTYAKYSVNYLNKDGDLFEHYIKHAS